MAQSDRLLDAYIALRGQIARLVMNIVPPKEVEDIVQETYVRVCQVENRDADSRSARLPVPNGKEPGPRPRQALRIAPDRQCRPRCAADRRLSCRRRRSDPTHAQVASDEEFALFCEAVRSLPRQCRRAFVLKKVYGYTLKEIMAEMDLGQPTVETHIVNGTKRCVQYLRERHVDRPAGLPARIASRPASNG